jgi:hypothetical protein
MRNALQVQSPAHTRHEIFSLSDFEYPYTHCRLSHDEGISAMKQVNVVLTMDCEPTTSTSDSSASGPKDWAQGERAVRGYVGIGKKHGFPISFFIHPETAIAQASMFKELEADGACLGLHVHPWKYSKWRHDGKRYFAHYGSLPAEEQLCLLTETATIWQDAIGRHPLYFRPGTFSANDSIFSVLQRAGFRGGSCSAPGRVVREMQAVWTATEPDPHRGHATFRQLRGELDFANVPLTADFSQLLSAPNGRRMHADLRPDTDWPSQYGISYQTIASNIVNQVKERAPAVPAIVIITHNHFELSDPNGTHTKRLHAALDGLQAACEAAGIRAVGARLDQIVDQVLAMPYEPEPFCCEGYIFEKAKTR